MTGEMLTCSVPPLQGTVSSATCFSCVLVRPRLIGNHLTNVFAGISEHCRETSFRQFHDAPSSHFTYFAGRDVVNLMISKNPCRQIIKKKDSP